MRSSLAASFDGLTVNPDGWEGFPSPTSDGQLAMISDTSVVHIYSAEWTTQADMHCSPTRWAHGAG